VSGTGDLPLFHALCALHPHGKSFSRLCVAQIRSQSASTRLNPAQQKSAETALLFDLSVNQKPHHPPRVILRQLAPVALLVVSINRGEVKRLHHLRHEPRQVTFRQPIAQRRREQKHLVQIAVAKLFAHAPILRTSSRL
jgi:hypothetical protein